jgi:hypothetical protein
LFMIVSAAIEGAQARSAGLEATGYPEGISSLSSRATRPLPGFQCASLQHFELPF